MILLLFQPLSSFPCSTLHIHMILILADYGHGFFVVFPVLMNGNVYVYVFPSSHSHFFLRLNKRFSFYSFSTLSLPFLLAYQPRYLWVHTHQRFCFPFLCYPSSPFSVVLPFSRLVCYIKYHKYYVFSPLPVLLAIVLCFNVYILE